MDHLINMPKLGANDETATLALWHIPTGSKVAAGQPICDIETTKATTEVEAEAEGFLVHIASAGDTVTVSEPIAAILSNPSAGYEHLLVAPTPPDETDGARWTKKAELVARRLGVSIADVTASSPDGVVREDDVVQHHASHSSSSASPIQRVAVIGSAAGGGAAIVVDILLRSPTQSCVAIYDRDATVQGRVILGVPVVGSSDIDAVEKAWKDQKFDAIILAFNRNLVTREEAFLEFQARGIPFANAIDVTVNMRAGVRMGAGNVIAGSSYIGAEAALGDNNFLSSNTCVEHHVEVGSHCGFGPGVMFSGRAKVGNRVRFGTQIAVEPEVAIGHRSVIASSVVLTTSVPDDSLVRARVAHTVHSISKQDH